MFVSVSSIERKIGVSSPVKFVPVLCIVPVEEMISQEDVVLPVDVFSDIEPIDKAVQDHVSVIEETMVVISPEDVSPDPEVSVKPDDTIDQDKLVSLHELVVSTTPVEVAHEVSQELVTLPDDVGPEDIISVQVDVSHERALPELLTKIISPVADQVASTTTVHS